ncbi:MAG: hypothetical protein LBF42_01430 [Puniceicoccales bacterium]|jgi:hypothetical protein|nr:hypothetical protein [Puniceicoccales bacterium]
MESAVLYLLGGIAAIVVIYGLASGKEKDPPVIKEKPSNLKLAIKDLRIARDNVGKNSNVAFIALLISAIKNYLAAEFKYVDSSKTSDEILSKFVHDVTNDWTASSLITEIFSMSDQVKFAKRELSVSQQKGLYKKACRLVLSVSRAKRRISQCK